LSTIDLRASKVLLVDDYELNNTLLARALAMYKVSMATNGADALAQVAMDPPDLILLDIRMPDIDGFEVCRRLKQSPGSCDIPIIFLTGMDDAATVAKGFQLGGVDYITKPIDVTEVQARVRNHLTLKKAQEDLKRQNELLEQTILEQQLNITLARNILKIINNEPPRIIDLNPESLLFVESICKPCHLEGGDHLLVKHNPRAAKTILSLKDQSGHAVNCVLRSIITDLFYNAMVFDKESRPLTEIVEHLNQTLCTPDLFQADEFCTAMMAELDHQSLVLTYVSAGHPPMLVLRGDVVIPLPGPSQDARNLPLGFLDEVSFNAGRFQLQSGDRLLIYSDGLHQLADCAGTPPISPQELIDRVQTLLAANPGQRVSLLIQALLSSIVGSIEQVAALLDNNTSGDDLSLIALEIEAKLYQAELTVKPCDFADIDAMAAQVVALINRDLEGSEFDNVQSRLAVAMPEAIVNAWKHGNRQDPTLPITIRWRFANDFSVEISDMGAGFNYRNLPNPISSRNLVGDSGRGIFIIRKFTDAVTWQDGGRRFIMNWRHPLAVMAVGDAPSVLALGHDLWLDT
jgi:CheY-like chemotaxis protein/serine phosphatase RsbU (regulator of sigma subunit)/anti-sigma regulatory factor (Ser/Thr protein kinase)